MEYVAVAFRSRADTVAFSRYLDNYGLRHEIINTPKEAGVGCGLSVKVNKNNFYYVKKAVHEFNRKSFAGFFLITEGGKNRIVRSI